MLPRNIVTGSREFHLIPSFIEYGVGSALYSTYIHQSGGEVSTKYSRYTEIVQRVGNALAENSPRKGMNFEFTVVKDWSINAWCLPGGKIAINLGLLDAMEKESSDFGLGTITFEEKVAAVLSHEITHATARHFGRAMELRIFLASLIKASNFVINYFIDKRYDQQIKKVESTEIDEKFTKDQRTTQIEDLKLEKQNRIDKISQIFNFFARLSVSGLGKCNSRSHELEAAKYGMHLMQKSNINPESALWLQHFFMQQKTQLGGGFFEWLSHLTSTHPSSSERLKANSVTLQQLNGK